MNKKWGTVVAERLQFVHIDVLGPVQQTSYEGFGYAIGLIDSYAVMYPLTSKDEAPDKLEFFLADVV